MKNVTLAIDEKLLESARALAERRKTSLNAIIRSLLAHEVEQDDKIAWAREGMRGLIEEAKAKADASGGEPYVWSRRDAYDEREDRLLSRHQHPDLRGFGEES
ncbi:MAG: ribbon-helix-helix protein, CopG family [Pseudomonadota bacterium]|nr:ribbon-helix-helix protein, CopG family [Pseudomonadota bacterium]